MKVAVDANILFACLIKDSTTRKLLFNPALTLFCPEFIVDELLRHIIEIKKKSGLSDEELHLLIVKVFGQLKIVADEDLKPFLPAAANLTKDLKDWLYISCALSQDTAIWSNDNDFRSQTRVKTLTTKKLVALIGSL